MKSYSIDLRERLVAGRQRGQSAEELSRVFGVSKRSVERYWKRQVQEGTLEPKARGGYRRSRLEGHDELLRQWIHEQPDLSLEQLRAFAGTTGHHHWHHGPVASSGEAWVEL